MLQFITHHTDRYDEIAGTRAVLEGGCRWVQLRMKDTPAEEVLRIGREIEKLCREYVRNSSSTITWNSSAN